VRQLSKLISLDVVWNIEHTCVLLKLLFWILFYLLELVF